MDAIEPIPEDCLYLWRAYSELCGAEHLTYQEIEAWQRLTRQELEPFESAAIMDLDRIHRSVINSDA